MKPNPTSLSVLTMLASLALWATADAAQAQAWLPEDLQLDERGMPESLSLGDLSLVAGGYVPFISDELMSGDRFAMTGLCMMGLSIALQPSFNHLIGGDWEGGVARSVGRIGTLALGGVGFYRMVAGSPDDRDGWAVLFNLTGAAYGVLLLWDMLDPPTNSPPALDGVRLSMAPLVLAPHHSAGDDAAPVLGLQFAVRF